jgi:predicted GTPase
VDVRFDKDGKTLIVIDTAGVRKKRHMVTNDIEFLQLPPRPAIDPPRRFVLMMLDGTERSASRTKSSPIHRRAVQAGDPRRQQVDLAMGYAREQHMANKKNEPIRDEELMEKFVEYAHVELKHLDYAPLRSSQRKTGKTCRPCSIFRSTCSSNTTSV